MGKHVLRLYVAGKPVELEGMVATVRDVCQAKLREPFELEVIDVLRQPQAAKEDQVLATPMLLQRDPSPQRRIVGDLTDRRNVLAGLDLPGSYLPTRRTAIGEALDRPNDGFGADREIQHTSAL